MPVPLSWGWRESRIRLFKTLHQSPHKSEREYWHKLEACTRTMARSRNSPKRTLRLTECQDEIGSIRRYRSCILQTNGWVLIGNSEYCMLQVGRTAALLSCVISYSNTVLSLQIKWKGKAQSISATEHKLENEGWEWTDSSSPIFQLHFEILLLLLFQHLHRKYKTWCGGCHTHSRKEDYNVF